MLLIIERLFDVFKSLHSEHFAYIKLDDTAGDARHMPQSATGPAQFSGGKTVTADARRERRR